MTANSDRRHRIPGSLWAALLVPFAAFFLVLLSGSPAHASDDEGETPRTLLSLLGKTASATSSAVGELTTPVVEQLTSATTPLVDVAITTVSDTVSTLPVVGPVLGTAVGAADLVIEDAADLLDTVIDLTAGAPLGRIADPVLDAAGSIPVIGNLLDDSGILDLVSTVVGIVDDAAGDAGSLVDPLLPPIIDPVVPTPEDPATPEPEDVATPENDDVATNTPVSYLGGTAGTTSSTVLASESALSTVPLRPLTPNRTTPAHGPPTTAHSSAQATGNSSHESARTHPDPFSALGHSQRTPLAPGDDLPTSPVADTDISPD